MQTQLIETQCPAPAWHGERSGGEPDGAARSAYASVRDHRDRQRQPSVQEPQLTVARTSNSRNNLRHKAVSYLAMSGISTVQIAEVLGHRTVQVIKRYAHLADAH